jgi:hypothetical protein
VPVSAAACLRLALALPETTEGRHEGLTTFLVRGKRFATLGWPDARSVSLNLAPADQQVLIAAAEIFSPVPGNWGRLGHTVMRLDKADAAAVRSGLAAGWRKAAPKTLAARLALVSRGKPSPPR